MKRGWSIKILDSFGEDLDIPIRNLFVRERYFCHGFKATYGGDDIEGIRSSDVGAGRFFENQEAVGKGILKAQECFCFFT